MQRPARGGGACDGQFAVRHERIARRRSDTEDRAVVDGAEQLDARVDQRRIVEPARPQLHVLEDGPIRPQRRVVVDAAGHVSPVTRRHFATRSLLEIEAR